jgi:hypothetical protein
MNTPEEREKMYITSRVILDPTYIVNFIEVFTQFAKDTKGMSYDERLELLKKEQYYDSCWNNWLEFIYSLDSFNSDGEYDDTFVPAATMQRVVEKLNKELEQVHD